MNRQIVAKRKIENHSSNSVNWSLKNNEGTYVKNKRKNSEDNNKNIIYLFLYWTATSH